MMKTKGQSDWAEGPCTSGTCERHTALIISPLDRVNNETIPTSTHACKKKNQNKTHNKTPTGSVSIPNTQTLPQRVQGEKLST